MRVKRTLLTFDELFIVALVVVLLLTGVARVLPTP
jgi:hypothetical protein